MHSSQYIVHIYYLCIKLNTMEKKNVLKSTLSYAEKNNIVTYKDFISESESFSYVYIDVKSLVKVASPEYISSLVGFDIENQEKILCAKIFDDKYKVLDARPFEVKKPKHVTNNKALDEYLSVIKFKSALRVAILTTYLNPDIDDETLLDYFEIVNRDVYKLEDNEYNAKSIVNCLTKAREYTEKDIKFQEKRFKFVNNFDKAIKKLKMTIVNKGMYKDISDEIHTKIRKAVYILIEDNEFIHSGNISEVSGVNISTVKKYREVFKDLVDSHNESRFETKVYAKYRRMITRDLINSAIVQLEKEDKKTTIKNISQVTGLHRNTISKYI